MRFTFTKIKIANHFTIAFVNQKPESLTTQSETLYRALFMSQARVHLQRNKACYGSEWGFDSPVLVSDVP